MTDLQEPAAPSAPAFRSHPSGRSNAFADWVDPARPKAKVWRLGLGLILAIVIWIIWHIPVLVGFVVWQMSQGEPVDTVVEGMEAALMGGSPIGTLVALSTFLGLWFGVWAAMGIMHRLPLAALLSPERRMRWGEFGIGALIGGLYLGAGIAIAIAMGMQPLRSDLAVQDYLMLLAPVIILLLIQTSAEEAFFRGYLVQQLGARFNSPLVWGGIPALLFGLVHYFNGAGTSTLYGVYYVAATFLIAVACTVLVWRTGSIAAAMGLHFINNAAIMLGVGTDDAFNSTQLWLWPEEMVNQQALWDLIPLAVLVAWVSSPWLPLRRSGQVGQRRNEMRAAP